MNKMTIRVEKNENKHFAYTDRINGYLELETNVSESEKRGYIRNNRWYIKDFFILLPEKNCKNQDDFNSCFRNEAVYTDVHPKGFASSFSIDNENYSLEASLLFDEQAFAIKTKNCGLGIAFPKLKRILKSHKNPRWFKYKKDGVFYWNNGGGISIASKNDFVLSFESQYIKAIPVGLYNKDVEYNSENPWYLVFEQRANESKNKVLRLAKENGLLAHETKVLEFLSFCNTKTNNKEFDKAIAWAQFSAWMLVTGKTNRGIWAGLPWFRDNWGRDTFIAFSGTLLVNGDFEEARSVILGFAEYQDKNPDSPTWGRIPNRYRNIKDVIYNTADGSLWFIRAVWEYLQYSNDTTILDEISDVIDLCFKAFIGRETDEHGFLLHGEADTWMDARIKGEHELSPRGNRANDIQALWYTSLLIGANIARFQGKEKEAVERENLAKKVKDSFVKFFYKEDVNSFADHLDEGVKGEWLPDFRVRPNQLFAITVPTVLDQGNELVSDEQANVILSTVNRELASPFGLYTLSPDDPLFHPKHINPKWHHKDAAYHNGTIWQWNTGPYISSLALHSSTLPKQAEAILFNYAYMILNHGTLGTLSENIHALQNDDGSPVLSGTWSQAWSLSEFARNIYQDLLGFNPKLLNKKIEMRPCLPEKIKNWDASLKFGKNWNLDVELTRGEKNNKKGVFCKMLWTSDEENNEINVLNVNDKNLELNKELVLFFEAEDAQDIKGTVGKKTKQIKGSPYILGGFPEHNLQRPWCGAIHKKTYLNRLILRDKNRAFYDAENTTASLEWYFDSKEFRSKYTGRAELGIKYDKSQTVFRLWAPTANSVSLLLYSDGDLSPVSEEIPMEKLKTIKNNEGVWQTIVKGDLHGKYYQYKIHAHGIIRNTRDPYAYTCGVNGVRSMVCDFEKTNPEGWENIKAPVIKSANDVVAYEVHVADMSSSPHWNGRDDLKRSYLGAAEQNTSYKNVPTGFDHICSLGVTHVQLLPIYDFESVDEKRYKDPEYQKQLMHGLFNWGYDPDNYNAPEGSYSSNPYDGLTRVKELKTLISSFISKGVGVIMDVVYNHVPSKHRNSLHFSVPGYYFRIDEYSGAGNDTASEREMFRQFMIDSLCWWLKEYKLSGFRFDLMGLHDVKTMNQISKALKQIKPDVVIYGEGWDMYRAKKMNPASMVNSKRLKDIGCFNDALRCGIKGTVFDPYSQGFIHNGSSKESVKFGLVGATKHPQVENEFVGGTANPKPWGTRTAQTVNYVSIHDNATLFDTLVLAESEKDLDYYTRLQKTAIGLVLFAQGMPILHAGVEFLRTKEISNKLLKENPNLNDLYFAKDKTKAFSHNSYNLSDEINALDWKRCAENQDLVSFVRSLIKIRKEHSVFRLQTEKEVASLLRFVELPIINGEKNSFENLLAWTIESGRKKDSWKQVFLVCNPYEKEVVCVLPPTVKSGDWHLVSNGDEVFEQDYKKIEVENNTSKIIVQPKTLYICAEF